MRLILLVICFLSSFCALCQGKKNERESRLKKDEVPSIVLKSVEDVLVKAKKIRFYAETDNDKKSFEVKLIVTHNFYSIEFDESGKLEDVELTILFKTLDNSSRQNIERHLASYDKYKIDKVQRQFSSPSKENLEIINNAVNQGIADVIKYEIEINVKKNSKWISYEMLFDESGEFISQREILHRTSDFILY